MVQKFARALWLMRSILFLAGVVAISACTTSYNAPRYNQARIGAGYFPPNAPLTILGAEEWSNSFQQLAATTGMQPPSVDLQAILIADGQTGSIVVPVFKVVFEERVFFDTASDQPLPEALPVLDVIAQNMKRSVPITKLTILGHTDGVGSDAYNMDLSRRRATNVLRALAARTVDPTQLSIIPIGMRQPVASNATPEGRALNRRVEFLISTSLPANVGVVSRRRVPAEYLPVSGVDPVELNDVEVLAPKLEADGYRLASLGSVSLAEPLGVPPASAQPAPDWSGQVPDPVVPAVMTDTGHHQLSSATSSAQPVSASHAVVPAVPAAAPIYNTQQLEPSAQPNDLGPAIPYQ